MVLNKPLICNIKLLNCNNSVVLNGHLIFELYSNSTVSFLLYTLIVVQFFSKLCCNSRVFFPPCLGGGTPVLLQYALFQVVSYFMSKSFV